MLFGRREHDRRRPTQVAGSPVRRFGPKRATTRKQSSTTRGQLRSGARTLARSTACRARTVNARMPRRAEPPPKGRNASEKRSSCQLETAIARHARMHTGVSHSHTTPAPHCRRTPTQAADDNKEASCADANASTGGRVDVGSRRCFSLQPASQVRVGGAGGSAVAGQQGRERRPPQPQRWRCV